MSDYPQYPTDPSTTSGGPAYGEAPAARGARPKSVDLAVKLIWTNIALGVLGAIITFVMLDSIIDQQMETAGVSTENLNADAIRSATVVGVVIGLIISVGLYALVAIFIAKGANWARIVYTVLAVLSVLTGVVGLMNQPALLLVLSLVTMLLTIGAVVMLFRSDANAWFKAR